MNLILLIKKDKNKEQASKIRKAEGLGGKKLLGKAACRPAAAYNSFIPIFIALEPGCCSN
ncbi:hypothetical protein ACQCVO_08710 [Bacillus infantis]|uniref:hypothetical protein n=1 Tax=Bacillus infantis TaxID=324767 RepID=UPI003CF4E47C